jgi:uncharacterized phage protein (TIGR01671 family)
MNNRFKFRVWDKLAKRMIYPHNDNQQHFIIDLNGRFHNLQNGSGGDDYVIQQYTGLMDSNEKEIYEGDIIEMTYDHIIERGFVVWENNSYILKTIGEDSYAPLVIFPKDKVIGNIFENKELLK